MKQFVVAPAHLVRASVVLLSFFLLALLSISAQAQDIPVVVNQTSDAKVMLLLDDSGSMNAVMEHPDFNAEGATATDSGNTIPSVFFRLESGSGAPATNKTLTPVLFEMNWGLWYNSGGNVYSGSSLSNSSNARLIKAARCTNSSGSSVYCPGGSPSAYKGIGVFQLYGNASIKGSNVFQLAHLATDGGSYVEDTNGNEFLYADYRKNDYVRLGRDWHGIWPKFDEDGDPVTVNTTAFVTTGGTVVFNGKEVFLSQGWYRIEYLRWIFYEASAAQLANLPGMSRMEVIKEVVEALITDNPSVAFGISTLNGSTYNPGVHNSGSYGDQMWTPEGDAQQGDEPKIRAEIGTDSATLITKLQGLASYGGTPLANTYIEVLRYFAGESDRDPYCNNCNYDSPIENECDSGFVVLLTDGLPSSESHNKVKGTWIYDFDNDNEDGSNRNKNCSSQTCANFLDDASYYAYNNDFATSIDGMQNIRSYAVGLGLDFSLLDDFAANGGSGESLRADTSDEISEALQNIVSNLVTTAVGAAGVAVAEVFGEFGQVYRPRFEAAHWTGDIDKYYSVNGNLVKQFSIGEILEERDLSTSPRTIFAGYDADGDGETNQTISFSVANASTLRPFLFELYDDHTLNSNLLADAISNYHNPSSAETLIQYIHGNDFENMRTRDADADGNVDRLGDIVYSRPRYVGQRNGRYQLMTGYTNFIQSLEDEPHLLLVGANDGMLHAFDAETGEELWAYIPSTLLKHLEVLARPTYDNEYHRYYVNGQISIEDVYFNGTWKTIAMVGLAEGGSTWIVLDITDRDNPSLLFEVSPESTIGESWNSPVVIVSGGGSTDISPANFDWRIAIGTGEGKATHGTSILLYDIQSGSVPTPTEVSLSASESAGTRLTKIAVAQNDLDLNVDRAYVGSESGDLYRILLDGQPASWTVEKLYDGSTSQPITAGAALVLVENPIFDSEESSGPEQHQYAVAVAFGTGRYDTNADVTTVGTTSQDIIVLYDPVDISNDSYAGRVSNLTKSNLENESFSSFNPEDNGEGVFHSNDNKQGFYISLLTDIQLADSHYIKPAGMVTHSPINVRGNIIFSTFLPNQDACSVGGHGFIQGVNFRAAGASVIDYILDAGDPFFNGGIPDPNDNGSVTSAEVEELYNDGLILPVLDTYVEEYDEDAAYPYVYDGEVSLDDIYHDSTGALYPIASSLGANGVPGPPSALYQDGEIVIQAAYIATVEIENEDDEDEEESQVEICHYPNGLGDPETRETLLVPESQLQSYLDAGDTQGACPDDDDNNKITICHIPPGNPANAHTIQVSANAWPAHEAHGDFQGTCDGDDDDDDDPEEEETTEETPFTTPITLYNQPVKVLTFHEETEAR